MRCQYYRLVLIAKNRMLDFIKTLYRGALWNFVILKWENTKRRIQNVFISLVVIRFAVRDV